MKRIELIIFGVICIYILVSTIFPIIRIPFSFLDEECTISFNKLAESLAVGYLSGVFIYYLTVIRVRKAERKHRIFEIYDLVNIASDAIYDLGNEFGKNMDMFDKEDYKKYTETIHSNFYNKLHEYLKDATLYRDFMTTKELYNLNEIRRMYKVIEPVNEYMDDKQKEVMSNTIKQVCILIENIHESVTKEISNRKNPK